MASILICFCGAENKVNNKNLGCECQICGTEINIHNSKACQDIILPRTNYNEIYDTDMEYIPEMEEIETEEAQKKRLYWILRKKGLTPYEVKVRLGIIKPGKDN